MKQPVVGETYDYELYTHCGIEFTNFGGRWWRAVNPVPPAPYSGAQNTTSGRMTLVEADLARFTWAAGSADFTPHPGLPRPCA
ncbi:hypothetical protein [Actinokineospora inagensis]|uniref:hypothetical protein n=1 Tax=Actinokineospora inagensis TaxID=103730 RepID=UPI0012FC2BC2|nr:hypothetical protein [Actinokineospora inagensis]